MLQQFNSPKFHLIADLSECDPNGSYVIVDQDRIIFSDTTGRYKEFNRSQGRLTEMVQGNARTLFKDPSGRILGVSNPKSIPNLDCPPNHEPHPVVGLSNGFFAGCTQNSTKTYAALWNDEGQLLSSCLFSPTSVSISGSDINNVFAGEFGTEKVIFHHEGSKLAIRTFSGKDSVPTEICPFGNIIGTCSVEGDQVFTVWDLKGEIIYQHDKVSAPIGAFADGTIVIKTASGYEMGKVDSGFTQLTIDDFQSFKGFELKRILACSSNGLMIISLSPEGIAREALALVGPETYKSKKS